MAVLGLSAIALDVPDIAAGIDFYRSAGLDAAQRGDRARFHCPGQARDCVILKGGAPAKRLNHVRLYADNLAAIAEQVARHGGTLIAPPPDASPHGLWVADPHGTVFHLLEQAPPVMVAPNETAHDRIVPRRLGHVMLFSPDVLRSAAFLTAAFGMRLSDHAEDIAAFCCAQENSDHHIVAFVKSDAIGFHHCSFEVADPDAVGRAGHALAQAAGRDAWGLGRHAIGDNFFHYIQDPWGSWFEYFSDVRHIARFADWTPGNHPPATALAAWGPRPPESFAINAESGAGTARPTPRGTPRASKLASLKAKAMSIPSSPSILGKVAATAAAVFSTTILILAVAGPDFSAAPACSPHACAYRHVLAQADRSTGIGRA